MSAVAAACYCESSPVPVEQKGSKSFAPSRVRSGCSISRTALVSQGIEPGCGLGNNGWRLPPASVRLACLTSPGTTT